MTPKAKGSYFGPKHLEQTTLGHTHFIENAHAKPRQHYLSALQKIGLKIWNTASDELFISNLFFALGTADSPGMTYLSGLVGHHGAFACQLYSNVPGRHKPGGTHYYQAHLKPDNYNIENCIHPDYNVRSIPPIEQSKYLDNLKYLLASENETNFKLR